MPENTVRFQISNFPRDMLRRLSIEAGYQCTSMSDVARKAIDFYLTRREHERAAE